MLDASITALIAPVVPDPVEGDTVTVAAEVSGAGPIEFDWVILRDSVAIETSSNQSFSFQAAEDGVYEAQLRLTDDLGETLDKDFARFIVGNEAPTFATLEIAAAPEGGETTLTGSLVDPGILDTHMVEVDWGDGTAIEQIAVDQGQGFASFSGSHIYADNGSYSVRVFLTDDEGGANRMTSAVDIANADPTLTVADDQMVDEGEMLSITNIGAVLDPGFDNPALSTVETFTYSIDWGRRHGRRQW